MRKKLVLRRGYVLHHIFQTHCTVLQKRKNSQQPGLSFQWSGHTSDGFLHIRFSDHTLHRLHTGNAWFDGYSGSVVKFILFQLIRQNRSGSNQAHGSSLCQLRNNFFSKISHKAQYYQLTLKISIKKEPLISQKSQILRFYVYSISPNCTILA